MRLGGGSCVAKMSNKSDTFERDWVNVWQLFIEKCLDNLAYLSTIRAEPQELFQVFNPLFHFHSPVFHLVDEFNECRMSFHCICDCDKVGVRQLEESLTQIRIVSCLPHEQVIDIVIRNFQIKIVEADLWG